MGRAAVLGDKLPNHASMSPGHQVTLLPGSLMEIRTLGTTPVVEVPKEIKLQSLALFEGCEHFILQGT